MKKNIGLICILVGMLLFVYKSVYCAKPETLPWQCALAGTIEVSQGKAFFTSQPQCGNSTAGFGIALQDTFEVFWYFYCSDSGSYEEIAATSFDSIAFSAGSAIVTCKVKMWQMGIGEIYISPSPSIHIAGSGCVDFIDVVAPASPPGDTLDPIDTVTVVPAPVNLYGVQNGVISLEGAKGIFVVLDFVTMLPVIATDFQGSLIYDLNLCCGSGMYLCYVVFTSPYENVDLGVISI